jgi:hypothetical protein
MGGRSKSSSTQQSNLDPELRKRQLANIDQASQIAGNLQARQFAGMSSGMTDAMGTARSLTQFSPAQIQAQQARLGQNIGLEDAMSVARGVSQFTPEQVRAGSFLNKNLQEYMNPFQQAVIDTSLADIERSRQLAAQTGAASAVRARAFGGSRQGVAEAETNRAALEQAARTSAQLRAQGFEAATGLMGQELSLEQQAALANQQAGLAGAQQRLSGAQALYGFGEGQQRLGLQADLANQEAAMRAAQSNQSAELQAAQQRAAAATQLYGMGSQEQQLEQARLDAERNLELERQQIRNQALGLNVGGGSGMQTTGSSRSSSFNISNPFGG